MSHWTSTARETLEGYLELNRTKLAAVGGDADEVVADLRRHVEAEAAALKLSVVTEQDVNRIVSRLGPVPSSENEKPTPERGNWNGKLASVGSFALLLFGVILPAGTLIFELVSHICAGTFFDPLPTWFHVLFVAAVPIANLWAWLDLHKVSPQALRWIWLANGVALGVSVFYTILYLPMSPFAVVGILFFGFGLLPLSPLLATICTLQLSTRLRRQFSSQGTTAPRGWKLSAILAAILLTLFALPGPLTRHWIDVAESESIEESTSAIKLLRTFGSEDVLLKECYGRTDRLWVEMFGGRSANGELAQKTFYRVTGKPFNSVPPPLSKYQRAGRDLFNDFEWDEGLGGENVAGQVKGLSLTASRMDGICKPEDGWAYLEWILEFRNDHPLTQREARAQIQLPPGGVVSRLTLWVNGEEREAAFAGRDEVREAYEKVAIQQRRDPVLVTTSGPDRVLVQCFPVQPKGGSMKVRIGITVPLAIENKDQSALRLPCFVERNFRLPDAFEHSLWLESSQQATAGLKKLATDFSKSGKQGLRGQISETELGSIAGVLRFEHSPDDKPVYAFDHKNSGSAVIKQTVETVPARTPARIAIVLDGSKGMAGFLPQIARALDGLPSQPEVSIWLAQDGLQNNYNSSWQSREPASTAVGRLTGIGGQDNIPGLLTAWEWAAAKPDGIVLWIHGTQPILLSNIESLKQRLDWRGAGDGPTILDVAVEPGPNRIAERLFTSAAVTALLRLGTVNDDLERLFGIWSQRTTQFQFTRKIDDEQNLNQNGSESGSSHIVRLWAVQEIQRLISARRIADAVKLANTYQLVTPVSGAVVLETKQQFDQAGLTPSDPATVPVIPEPSTWALLMIGFVALLFRKKIQNGIRKKKRA